MTSQANSEGLNVRPMYVTDGQQMDTTVGSVNSSDNIETNGLESVINNYNRICSQLPQNRYNDWLQRFYDLMRSEWTRLRTFTVRTTSKWSLDYVTPEDLANAGFFFLNGDRVQCAFCRGIVSGWERGDRPLAEHGRHFPRCPFIMEEDVGNVPIGNDPIRGPKRGHDVCGNMMSMNGSMFSALNPRNAVPVDMREYGVQPHRGPKNPDFKAIDSRRRSYQNNCWDFTSVPVSTDSLSDAGFFSIGMSDYVKCFYCDGGLCNWELGDDPWVEHAKWFPECHFLGLNKSQTFIDECKRLANNETSNPSESGISSESDPESNSSDEESSDSLSTRAVNEWMNTDIVIQLIDLNSFSVDLIKAVLNRRWRQEKRPFNSFAQLYDTVQTCSQDICFQRSHTNHEITQTSISPEPESSGVSSDDELPGSQSSVSSTTSTLSSYSSSDEKPIVVSNSESELSPKPEDNRLLCKICLDREIGVVFLPCGHQLACTQCAPCITDCPVCRKVIRGTVRTFFS